VRGSTPPNPPPRAAGPGPVLRIHVLAIADSDASGTLKFDRIMDEVKRIHPASRPPEDRQVTAIASFCVTAVSVDGC
jgi:hypothetical protein